MCSSICRPDATTPTTAETIAIPLPTAAALQVRMCSGPSAQSIRAMRCMTQSGQGSSPAMSCTAKPADRISTSTPDIDGYGKEIELRHRTVVRRFAG